MWEAFRGLSILVTSIRINKVICFMQKRENGEKGEARMSAVPVMGIYLTSPVKVLLNSAVVNSLTHQLESRFKSEMLLYLFLTKYLINKGEK